MNEIILAFNYVQDVFIVDGLDECFVWIGKDASTTERKQAMSYAHVRVEDSPILYCSLQLFTALYSSLGGILLG